MLSIQEQSNLDKMKIQAYRVMRSQLSYVTQSTTPEERLEALSDMIVQLQTSIDGIDDYVDSLY